MDNKFEKEKKKSYAICITRLKEINREYLTNLTILSDIAKFTIAAITSFKVDTGSSVLAWVIHTLVYICRLK